MSNYNKFFTYLPKNNINLIFEVGSRDLKDAITLQNYFNAKVYAYEANPLMHQICKENLNNNTMITFCPYGLGDKITQKEFYVYTPNLSLNIQSIGASSFFQRTDNNINQTKYDKPIFISTIEKEAENFNLKSIDLLCMDVQGYELNILKGCNDFITKINYIILEIPKSKNEILENEKKYNIKDSYYIGAPDRNEIINYLTTNNFEIIAEFEENLFENNILLKNINFK